MSRRPRRPSRPWATSRLAALLLAFSLSSAALACGYCIEDRIAAVYDHAQVTAALVAHRHVAYVAVQGNIADADTTRAALAQALATEPAVQAGSLRFDAAAESAAFVLDPAVKPAEAVVAALNKALAPQRITLGLMRLLDAPGRLQPATP